MSRIPHEVQHQLRTATQKAHLSSSTFKCVAFQSEEWNAFAEIWAPRIHSFLLEALGPMGQEPLPTILPMSAGHHMAWATASFDPASGQIRLSDSIEGKPGQTLEKLTHEMTHASLAQFPEGDSFYEEGFVDYSVWVMAHAPVWGEHREAMVHAAEYNIAQRRERAMRQLSDWDVKRWAGGLYANVAFGPFIVSRLKARKTEGVFEW
jgi:hypothetical protein